MCSRTSGNSSLSICRNIGRRCAIVLLVISDHWRTTSLYTYSSLPNMGARPLICVPKAARTCWDESETRSSTLDMISFRSVSRSSKPQKPCIIVSNDCQGVHYRHTRDLSSYGGPNFCFRIFQQLDKCRYQVTVHGFLVYCFCNLASHPVSGLLLETENNAIPFQTDLQPCTSLASSCLRKDSVVLKEVYHGCSVCHGERLLQSR